MVARTDGAATNAAPLGDLSLTAPPTLTRAAHAAYTRFEAATAGLAVPERPVADSSHVDWQEYWDSEWVTAAKPLTPILTVPHDYFCLDSGGRDTFVERAELNHAISATAVVIDGSLPLSDSLDRSGLSTDPQGNLFATQGTVGWFAQITSDYDGIEWERHLNSLIAALAAEEPAAWLSVYDLHI